MSRSTLEPAIFKPDKGKFKNFELELKFKHDSMYLVFYKTRLVPFLPQEDLQETYDPGVKRGVWERTRFNDYGTQVRRGFRS